MRPGCRQQRTQHHLRPPRHNHHTQVKARNRSYDAEGPAIPQITNLTDCRIGLALKDDIRSFMFSPQPGAQDVLFRHFKLTGLTD